MEPLICFPYLTRLVSNSWHTSDGVLPTNGRAKSHGYETVHGYKFLSYIVVIEQMMMEPAYDLFLGPCP